MDKSESEIIWQSVGLWDYLKDKIDGNYYWRKERRNFANCYVCFYIEKEIGLIPIEYDETDVEWQNWWESAYQRHNKLSLNKLMNEITDRHQRQMGR